MVAAARGAREGILVRDAEALESLARIDALVIDKTGTLTEGKPRVTSVVGDEEEVLCLAAGLEGGSEHPLAAAILAAAAERGITPARVDGFASVTGKGVRGKAGGRALALGSRAMVDGPVPAALEAAAEESRSQGNTVVHLSVAGAVVGVFSVADPVRPTTPEALDALRQQGVRIVMATGDNVTTAAAVGRRLGIDHVDAETLPADKADLVARLKAEGRRVATAGDGVDDAPALARADVGIALGTGTDVARESAGIVLVRGDLRGIVRARRLSRATRRNIRQNLAFAFGYNALGVPVAAGALYPLLGLLLNPMIASAAMALSSVSVAANALRLRRVALGDGPSGGHGRVDTNGRIVG